MLSSRRRRRNNEIQQESAVDDADADALNTDDDNEDADDDDDMYCMRGLETMTKTGSKLRIRFRDTSRQVVLREQEGYKIRKRLQMQRSRLAAEQHRPSQGGVVGGCGRGGCYGNNNRNNNNRKTNEGGDSSNSNDNTRTEAVVDVEAERIAELYKLASDRCSIFAVTLGKNDERVAQEIYK